MNFNNFLYKIRRLKSIRPEELTRRIALWASRRRNRRMFLTDPDGDSVQRLYERRDQWLNISADENPSEVINHALSASLPTGWWNDDLFWKKFSVLYPEATAQLIRDAEEVLSGVITLFEWKRISLSHPFHWSSMIQPESNSDTTWPDHYYTDMKVHHDSAYPDRDVKWCWELNRFQHLLCLGAAWRLTHDDRFAREAREHIESWIETIRYPLGVHWAGNLEVALRSLSWARCHILCINSPSWDSDFVNRFITALYLHVRHLHQELTTHHPPGNHLLGETSALLSLSIFYPLFTGSSLRLNRAVKILDTLIPRLILEDGVYAEQTTGYFRFICEFLLPIIRLCRHRGISFTPVVYERLAAGLRWVGTLSPRPTDIPMLGDADTGVAVGWRLSDYWDFTPLLSNGAVLFDKPDLATSCDSFPAESFLMLGLEGKETFDGFMKNRKFAPDEAARSCSETVSASSTIRMCSFPQGGYDVTSDPCFHTVFDAGPLGIAPAYGHGHADALSWTLAVNGTALIVDPGTCHYNARREWRNYFRSANAHNTIQPAGCVPAQPLDTFRWAGNIQVTRRLPLATPTARAVGGSMRSGEITHHRLLFHVFQKGVIVSDHLDGEGEYTVEYRLHFDPRWDVHLTDDNMLNASFRDDSVDFAVLGPKTDLSLIQGSENPRSGWYSRYYAQKIPTCTLLGHIQCTLPSAILLLVTMSEKPFTFPLDIPNGLFPEESLELLQRFS